MGNLFDHPLLVLALSGALLGASAWLGGSIGRRRPRPPAGEDDGFSFVMGGTLTLLALLVGFTFSMAVGRYDQRKAMEEEEANAIGTELARADLMPRAEAEEVRALLRRYLDHRIRHYLATTAEAEAMGAETARLQGALWTAAARHATGERTPAAALVAAGMNDVLNAQGRAEAAARNRIPGPAWALLLVVSVLCTALLAHGVAGKRRWISAVLPLALSVTLLLIADIESPRGGLVLVHPKNLEATAAALRAP